MSAARKANTIRPSRRIPHRGLHVAGELLLNIFRQIADDTASLVRDIRRGLAHVAWKLSWWRRKKQVRSEEVAAERENLRRGAAAPSKMCVNCRALIPSGAGTCPECGVSTAHIRSGGIERRVSAALPFKMNVSMMLITACFAMFILGMILSLTLEPREVGAETSPLQALLHQDPRALLMTGANEGSLSRGPEPWRLLTAIFLHGGILHLAFNTMALLWFGQLIENIYGPSRMFVIFIVTGVAGNALSLWWHGLRWFQVGASGAIFGLVGVAAVYAFTHKDALAEALRGMIVRVVMWAVMLSFIPGVDNAAHFGGMVAGLGFAWILPDPSRLPGVGAERLWRYLARTTALGCAAALAFTFVRWAVLG